MSGRALLMLLIFLAFPAGAFAHRLDEYLQATLVAIEPQDIRLQMNLTPGVAVAEKVLAEIDRDHDGVISTNEAAAYAGRLQRDLTLWVDDRVAPLRLETSTFPTLAELRTGSGIILLEYSFQPGLLRPGAHRLTLENRHLPAVSVYLFNALHPRSDLIQITRQKRNENQSVGEIAFAYRGPPTAKGTSATFAALAVLLAVLVTGIVLRYTRAMKSAGKIN